MHRTFVTLRRCRGPLGPRRLRAAPGVTLTAQTVGFR
ncbi:hypothetical protein SUDANB108_00604 [Streptomyces sp. enrichment culture]